MATNDIQGKTAKVASARMAGEVSTVTVRDAWYTRVAIPDHLFCKHSVAPLNDLVTSALAPHAVCRNDDACRGFPVGELAHERDEVGTLDYGDSGNNKTCYKGGETVFRSYQMCDVTSAYRPLALISMLIGFSRTPI